MNLSKVCYEAACIMSESTIEEGVFSCVLIEDLTLHTDLWKEYSSFMSPSDIRFLTSDNVRAAAKKIGWSTKDFRTFLLLMASEAFK